MTYTPKQFRVLQYIYRYQRKNRLNPTTREIALFLGVKSPHSITQYIVALVRKGAIQRSRGEWRSMSIVDIEFLTAEKEYVDLHPEVLNECQLQLTEKQQDEAKNSDRVAWEAQQRAQEGSPMRGGHSLLVDSGVS